MMQSLIFRVLYVFMVLFGVFFGLSNPSYSMAPRELQYFLFFCEPGKRL